MRLLLIMVFSLITSIATCDQDYQIWTDCKGKTLSAKFLGFSNDRKLVILESQKTRKRLAIDPKFLSCKDKIYVWLFKDASLGELYVKKGNVWVVDQENRISDVRNQTAATSDWLTRVYREAQTEGTLLYFVWTEYDQWNYSLKQAIKLRNLEEAIRWYEAIEKTVKINYLELGNLHRALSESDNAIAKAYAKKCWEVITEKYKNGQVSRCFTVSLLCSSPERVRAIRKDNFDRYGLDKDVMDMFFSENSDEYNYVSYFVPRNLLIDGQIDGDRAIYDDGTTCSLYGRADYEHSDVANMIVREHETISNLFKNDRDAGRFLSALFQKYPKARLFREKYREILPKLSKRVASEGRLSSQDADDYIQ